MNKQGLIDVIMVLLLVHQTDWFNDAVTGFIDGIVFFILHGILKQHRIQIHAKDVFCTVREIHLSEVNPGIRDTNFQVMTSGTAKE